MRVLSSFSQGWLLATPWTIAARLPCPWDSPGKNTAVGCHALLQGIFQTRGLNSHLLRCRWVYCWATGGSPHPPHLMTLLRAMRVTNLFSNWMMPKASFQETRDRKAMGLLPGLSKILTCRVICPFRMAFGHRLGQIPVLLGPQESSMDPGWQICTSCSQMRGVRKSKWWRK